MVMAEMDDMASALNLLNPLVPGFDGPHARWAID